MSPKVAVSRHLGLLVSRNFSTQKGLAFEIKPHVTLSKPATIQDAVSMANHLTTYGIKDGTFKKKENTRNKKKSNDQNKNQEKDDRNKRQRTRRKFAVTILEQGQAQRQYAGQHLKKNCLRRNRTTTSGGNRPSPVLAIEGNTNHGTNRNRAQGRDFGLGVAEAP
nr:hypothetical protein [Tanacetum cinerariifolium]